MTWVRVGPRPIRASVPISVSAELAEHHLDQHSCEKTGQYQRSSYRCEHDGAVAHVLECDVCSAPLVVVPDEPRCPHFAELLEFLGAAA